MQLEGQRPSDSSPNSATSGTATSGRGQSFEGEARVLSELCCQPVRHPSLRNVSVGGICIPPDCGGDKGLPWHALIIVVVIFVINIGGGSVGQVNGMDIVVSVIVIIATVVIVVIAVAVVWQILAIVPNRGLCRPPKTTTAAAPTANPCSDASIPPSSVVRNILSRLWFLRDAFNTIVPAYVPMMPPPPCLC